MNRYIVRIYAITILLTLTFLLGHQANAQTPEVRAFWIDAWGNGILTQAQVDSLLGVVGNPNSKGEIREANCNTVFVEVRRRGDVNYPSMMGEPYMSNVSPDFDALQAIIKAAHDTTGGKSKVEVHAWFVMTKTGRGATKQAYDDPSDPDNYWMSLTNSGAEDDGSNDGYMFDPGHPKAAEYLADVCLDVACNYDVDGIHMDLIRYSGQTFGYNPTSIERFNAFYGRTGQPTYTDAQFSQWRRDQITALVRKIYAKTIAAKPDVKISAATVSWTPAPATSTRSAFQSTRPYYQVFQDWDAWMQEGILDEVAVMNYYNQSGGYAADFTRWMNFTKDRKANRHAIIGPGLYLNSLDDAILQLKMTRYASSAGNYAQGFCGYSYRQPYTGNSWPLFKPRLVSDVNPTAADIPEMSWKTNPAKGHIMGRLTDASSGKWIDGATVTLSGGTSRTMTCDGTGFYAFIDLAPGTYTVTAEKGGYPSLSASVTVTTGNVIKRNFGLGSTDTTNPTVPANFVKTNAGPTKVSLAWSASTDNVGVAGYNIYRNKLKIATTAATSFTDSAVKSGTKYIYNAAAYDAVGNESVMSNDLEIDVPEGFSIILDEEQAAYTGSWASSTYPAAYNGDYNYTLTASSETATAIYRPTITVPGDYDIYAKFVASSNRTSKAPYTIHYNGGTLNVQTSQYASAIMGTQAKIATALPFAAGTSGYVKLGNGTGEGSLAVIADAIEFVYTGISDTTAPSVPQNLQASASSQSQINLIWTASMDDLGVAGYKVFRNGSYLASVTTNSYSDKGLSPNTTYSYTVAAYDFAQNQSAASSAASRATLSIPPSTSTVTCDKSASAWQPANPFTFTATGGFGAGKVAYYAYAWDTSSTHTWTGSEPIWNSGTKELNAVSGKAGYYLHLRGFNTDGAANGTLDLGPYKLDTSAPSAPVVTDDGAYTASGIQINAGWTASDSESGIAEYQYAVGTISGGTDVVGWTSTAAASVTATIPEQKAGTTLYVSVKAKNGAGTFGEIGISDGISVGIPKATIAEAIQLGQNQCVAIANRIITAVFADCFYVADDGLISGIRVDLAVSYGVGTRVDIGGKLQLVNGERRLVNAVVKPVE